MLFVYFFRDDCHDDAHFHSLYEALEETCTLEVDLMPEQDKNADGFSSKLLHMLGSCYVHWR